MWLLYALSGLVGISTGVFGLGVIGHAVVRHAVRREFEYIRLLDLRRPEPLSAAPSTFTAADIRARWEYESVINSISDEARGRLIGEYAAHALKAEEVRTGSADLAGAAVRNMSLDDYREYRTHLRDHVHAVNVGPAPPKLGNATSDRAGEAEYSEDDLFSWGASAGDWVSPWL